MTMHINSGQYYYYYTVKIVSAYILLSVKTKDKRLQNTERVCVKQKGHLVSWYKVLPFSCVPKKAQVFKNKDQKNPDTSHAAMLHGNKSHPSFASSI